MTPQPATAAPAPTAPPTPVTAPEANRPHGNGKPHSPAGPSRLPKAQQGRARLRLALLGLGVLGGSGLLAAWYFLWGGYAPRADLILHTVRREKLLLTITERGTLESADNRDIICRVKAKSQGSNVASSIKSVIDDGSHVKGPRWDEKVKPDLLGATAFGLGADGPFAAATAVLAGRRDGDLLIELDDSGLQEQLKSQLITRDRAWNDWAQALANVQIVKSDNDSKIANADTGIKIAELARDQYLHGLYQQEIKDIRNRTLSAEADLQSWRDRVSYSERMVKKDYIAVTQLQLDRNKLQAAEIVLKRVQEELRVLEDYTYKMRKTELESKLDEAKRNLYRETTQAQSRMESAENDAATKKRIYEQEQDKVDDILDEIRKCVITAPQDGMVVYYVSESGRYSSSSSQQQMVEQGASVREGQKLMRLPNLENMQVIARVHEAMVTRVREGQKAQIRVVSLPEDVFSGRVKSVAAVASQAEYWSSDVKVYQTVVTLDKSIDGLRPGMSAEVTIYTDIQLEDVLTVPVQAILGSVEMGRTRKCLVETPTGPEEREIVIGLSNDKMAEVKEGLREGDQVIVNPKAVLGDKVKVRQPNGSDKAGGTPEGPAEGPGKGKAPPEGPDAKKGGKAGGKGSPEERQKQMERFKTSSPAERKQMLDQAPEAAREKIRQGLKAQGLEVPD